MSYAEVGRYPTPSLYVGTYVVCQVPSQNKAEVDCSTVWHAIKFIASLKVLLKYFGIVYMRMKSNTAKFMLKYLNFEFQISYGTDCT